MTSSISGSSGFGSPIGLGGSGRPDPAKMQERFFAKADVNGDGSIDKTELTSTLEKISKRTGSTSSIDVDSLVSALDSSGDGSISPSELSENASALFEQLRGKLGGPRAGGFHGAPPSASEVAEGLFSKIDANGDDSLDESELSAHLAQRASAGSGFSVEDLLSETDTNEDGAISQDELTAALAARFEKVQTYYHSIDSNLESSGSSFQTVG
jgi:Ca2+-binding EF-hand superfamily protein